MKCNCGENAFYIKKTYSENKYIITSEIYKCGRNIDNTKKTKCDFNFEKELSRIDESNESNKSDVSDESKIEDIKIDKKKNIKKYNIVFIDFKTLLYKHLEYYDTRLTNYFGILNYYLAKYNIPVHIPKIENYEK